jgi:hypothetical protein
MTKKMVVWNYETIKQNPGDVPGEEGSGPSQEY